MTNPWPTTSYGSPTHPAVVFLHGFMGRGDDWHEITEKLSDKYYCICPDLPGHGKNVNRPIDAPLNFENVSKELIGLLDELRLEKVNLVGYSMGGRIALYTACHYPERINTLTIESANPGIQDEDARKQRANLDKERAEKIKANGIETFVEKWYQAPLFASLHDHPILLDKVKTARMQNDPVWMAKVIAEMSPGRQTPLWDKLSQLTMPVMLLSGNLDGKYIGIMHKLSENIDGARVETIPNVGHNAHLEAQDQFTTTLETFLNEYGKI